MNTITTLKKRIVATSAAITLAFTGMAPAALFQFVPFGYTNATLPGDLPNDPALSPISISAMVTENAGKLYLMILNTSDQNDANVDGTRPVVTSIFIEDPTNILGAAAVNLFDAAGSIGTVVGEGVDYGDADPGGNLPSGANIGFTSRIHFDTSPPPSKNGVDPGEKASFELGATDLATVEAALANDTIRIGIHVQQIGANADSAVFIHMPEPSSALLGLLGTSILLLRRRR